MTAAPEPVPTRHHLVRQDPHPYVGAKIHGKPEQGHTDRRLEGNKFLLVCRLGERLNLAARREPELQFHKIQLRLACTSHSETGCNLRVCYQLKFAAGEAVLSIAGSCDYPVPELPERPKSSERRQPTAEELPRLSPDEEALVIELWAKVKMASLQADSTGGTDAA